MTEQREANRVERELARRERQRLAVGLARSTGLSVSYTDDDGCEITATPSGHVFYNAVDWY